MNSHKTTITTINLIENDQFIISSSIDSVIKFWDMKENVLIKSYSQIDNYEINLITEIIFIKDIELININNIKKITSEITSNSNEAENEI